MKNQALHPADKFARWMLKQYPGAEEQMQHFLGVRQDLKDDWPAWCYLPMAAVYAIITKGASVDIARSIMAESIDDLPKLTAALVWSRTKTVYQFDATLSELLAEQAMDTNIPVDVLYRLPYPCIYIEQAGKLLDRAYAGYFAWLEYDVNNRQPELRLLYLMRDGGTASYPLVLQGNSIAEFWTATEASARKRMPNLTPSYAPGWPLYSAFASAINHILYLCADNADTRPIQGSGSVVKERRSPLSEPQLWEVGTRIGAAIRKYKVEGQPQEETSERPAEGQVHASPKPHVRRAHWHMFWTGKRDASDRQFVVHWLAPIPVNYRYVNKDTPTVIRKVKSED